MGLGSIMSGIAGALNPVGLIANVGAGVLGGGLDYMASEADRRSQEAQAASANLTQRELAERNFQMQREFAQKGIRWRVEDAEAAGLHPLAALGMQPTPSSPVSMFTESGASSSKSGNLFRGLSGMGQNIHRAIAATQTMEERLLRDAEIEKVKAEGDYARAMAAESLKRTSLMGPAMPSPYSGVSGDAVTTKGPFQHQIIRTPNGYSYEYSPEYSAGLQSRPLSMWLRDIKEIMSGPKYGRKSGRSIGGVGTVPYRGPYRGRK